MSITPYAQIYSGPPIPPAARVQLMDDGAFEALVHHWMGRIKARFCGVDRFGGPGDMGRDVICWESDEKCLGTWDNIQCKRYDKVLGPSDLWPEIGKVFWHASRGDYVLPRSMRFLCSKGIGTSAKHLLTNPGLLKKGLIDHWDKNVRTAITSTQAVVLNGELKELVDKTDFGIFGPMSVEEILKDLESTAYYVTTFGGGLPSALVRVATSASRGDGVPLYSAAFRGVCGTPWRAVGRLDESGSKTRRAETL